MGFSTLSGNTAGHDGGGAFISAGSATFTGTTIPNNSATNEGGGLWENSTASLTLTRCTGGGNTAPTGPGGYVEPGACYSNDGSFTDEGDF
ncbi:MAG TPA: hypothetical protein VFE78_24370 [Gemmataceae bacterium]|jgi:hypothetical protein|nr:hypothetical protein [Gemmataceae bacterium]